MPAKRVMVTSQGQCQKVYERPRDLANPLQI